MIEVHYKWGFRRFQYIKKTYKKYKKPIYLIPNGSGVILKDNIVIGTVGNTKIYQPNSKINGDKSE
jgi:hypothetical protein